MRRVQPHEVPVPLHALPFAIAVWAVVIGLGAAVWRLL